MLISSEPKAIEWVEDCAICTTIARAIFFTTGKNREELGLLFGESEF